MLQTVTNLVNGVKSQLYWRNLVKEGQSMSRREPRKPMAEPIDFVVTWVDDQDPAWRAQKDHFEQVMGIPFSRGDNGEERYRDWELFRYWFRAVEKYAPWVRNVYLVTWGHVPQWLNLDAPKLRVVKHTDFIPEQYLPTFNCNPIELNLHRLPDLSEFFVYFNDDISLNRPVTPEDFFWAGEPNYSAIARPIENEGNSAFSHMTFTVLGAINQRFGGQVSRIIQENPEKWFADAYGSWAEQNLYAAKRGYLPGMYFSHLAAPFRKRDFQRVWTEFPELMEETSRHKFRTPQDAFHQIVSLRTIMAGEFHPVSMEHNGMHFWAPENQLEQILEAVEQEKYLSICINDSPSVSREDYLRLKREIGCAMQRAFPEKSAFEK